MKLFKCAKDHYDHFNRFNFGDFVRKSRTSQPDSRRWFTKFPQDPVLLCIEIVAVPPWHNAKRNLYKNGRPENAWDQVSKNSRRELIGTYRSWFGQFCSTSEGEETIMQDWEILRYLRI